MSSTLPLAFVAICALSLASSIGDIQPLDAPDSSISDSHPQLSDAAFEVELKRRGLVLAGSVAQPSQPTMNLLQEAGGALAGSGNASEVPSNQFQAWPAIFEGVKNLPLAKARAEVVKYKCKENATGCEWSTVDAALVVEEYGKQIVSIVKKQCTVTHIAPV